MQAADTAPAILVINPGSTSTRTAVFRGGECVAEEHCECRREELNACPDVNAQVPLRTAQVEAFLRARKMTPFDFAAVAARGGPLRPVPGGVYRVNAAMLADARSKEFVEHVSRIACLVGHALAVAAGIDAYVVDPVSTDEYEPVSRVSGIKELPRKSLVHALNLRAVARLHARRVGRGYEELNLITAQLGGGISIAAHRRGRMVDSVDANGEGPFSPERSGGLRVDSLARLVLGENLDLDAVRARLTRRGGFMSHLGTTDARAVLARIERGDREAALVFDAMAYNIAKHISALAVALGGEVDAVILTGGLAHAAPLVENITRRVRFLAPVEVCAGEYEMQALAAGVARVLAGGERPRSYPDGAFC